MTIIAHNMGWGNESILSHYSYTYKEKILIEYRRDSNKLKMNSVKP